jgi:hypothetical protein
LLFYKRKVYEWLLQFKIFLFLIAKMEEFIF